MAMINWTEIIIFAIGLVISLCVSLLTKQAIPWLKSKNLYEAAVVAVEAAEALYGRYKGEDKLKAALDQMKAQGYDVESERVIAAVQAAWKQLDTAMHASGEKELLGVNG
jgi:hypothetical protein